MTRVPLDGWILTYVEGIGYHLRVTIYFLEWKLFKLDILAWRWALDFKRVWIYPPSLLDDLGSLMADNRIFVEE